MRNEAEDRLVQQENMQDMMAMGEDDDYGDMDGDENVLNKKCISYFN